MSEVVWGMDQIHVPARSTENISLLESFFWLFVFNFTSLKTKGPFQVEKCYHHISLRTQVCSMKYFDKVLCWGRSGWWLKHLVKGECMKWELLFVVSQSVTLRAQSVTYCEAEDKWVSTKVCVKTVHFTLQFLFFSTAWFWEENVIVVHNVHLEGMVN